MVRSRLPVASLLGLFGALLMLFPQLLLGSLSDLPVTDPLVLKALASSVVARNARTDSAHYFKVLRVASAKLKMENGRLPEFHLKVELVETTCKKKTGEKIKTYKEIEKCDQLPGNPKKPFCFFTAISRSPQNKMFFVETSCV